MAFEVLSKTVTPHVLKLIQEAITVTRIQFSDEELIALWPKIQLFKRTSGHAPDLNSVDPIERRMAEAVIYIKRQRQAAGL